MGEPPGQKRATVPLPQISAICFLTPTTWLFPGYGSGNPTVYRTTDGGATLLPVGTTPETLTTLSFGEGQTGYGSNADRLYKTRDGGMTWQRLVYPGDTNTNSHLYSVRAFGDKICYIRGQRGLVLKTTDGGQTWQNQRDRFDGSEQAGDLFSDVRLNFSTAQTGYANVRNEWYKTINGGQSWHYSFFVETSAQLGDASFPDSTRFYLAADAGNILTITPGVPPVSPQLYGTNALCLNAGNTQSATYSVPADASKSFLWQLSWGWSPAKQSC